MLSSPTVGAPKDSLNEFPIFDISTFPIAAATVEPTLLIESLPIAVCTLARAVESILAGAMTPITELDTLVSPIAESISLIASLIDPGT